MHLTVNLDWSIGRLVLSLFLSCYVLKTGFMVGQALMPI